LREPDCRQTKRLSSFTTINISRSVLIRRHTAAAAAAGSTHRHLSFHASPATLTSSAGDVSLQEMSVAQETDGDGTANRRVDGRSIATLQELIICNQDDGVTSSPRYTFVCD